MVPTGAIVTVVRPESVSTCACARGALGARLSSHGDAGTSAGAGVRPGDEAIYQAVAVLHEDASC